LFAASQAATLSCIDTCFFAGDGAFGTSGTGLSEL